MGTDKMQLMLPIAQTRKSLDQAHQILVRIMAPEHQQLAGRSSA